ncbi:arginine--tRNA ligase [Planosporangium mesophilum]|uniref:Arginine--tRNA ligase n=1 Tax=Planosporangium mesophilum TaxID=689768 RepID=A0A8J3WZZ8_9ACTN|nr:arginine--tRNA ligase [Planosporangium mesophilum]NJC84147.1 arginine--tRNA ligase [Planosporangium mesophilum]GII22850.1 arginine--tRNA ligase [Planosporangium mesophilum]
MTDVVATKNLVETAVSAAMAQVLPAELAGGDPLVRRSEHADFQSNVALALAKQAKRPPREIAQAVADAIDAHAVSATTSGPGFLNLTVPDATLWERIGERVNADRLGIGTPLTGERMVIDYSAPNIAKEMHVGHLRTTIIGDALARILGFLGADVVRQNHLGDWGTQFGMLIQYIDEHPELPWRHQGGDVSTLDALYRAARAQFDADLGFADRARSRVVALQSGDAATLAVWRELVAESELAFQALYDRLGVLLTPADSAGESTYNLFLADVVEELVAAGIVVESDGALCVFFDDITGPDGDRVPLIVRKSDGGFGYAATDLATIRYRIRDLKATRILYVVDARQAMHFRMVFATARRAGWLTDDVHAVHVPFGTVLAADGRPFKTRSGGTVRLSELLDAAVGRARDVISEKAHGLAPDELEHVVQAAGIGAVKYADLSTSRTKDYTFDVDRMVSFTGNTGVYLQYAHVRTRSILAKLPEGAALAAVDTTLPLHPAERALALALDDFADTLADVADTLEPHRLCGYLFALAKAYTDFFESCPVLRAETAAQRGNRVALCRLTGRTLATGLHLLGIEAPQRL